MIINNHNFELVTYSFILPDYTDEDGSGNIQFRTSSCTLIPIEHVNEDSSCYTKQQQMYERVGSTVSASNSYDHYYNTTAAAYENYIPVNTPSFSSTTVSYEHMEGAQIADFQRQSKDPSVTLVQQECQHTSYLVSEHHQHQQLPNSWTNHSSSSTQVKSAQSEHCESSNMYQPTASSLPGRCVSILFQQGFQPPVDSSASLLSYNLVVGSNSHYASSAGTNSSLLGFENQQQDSLEPVRTKITHLT